jgi:hypothetical protein
MRRTGGNGLRSDSVNVSPITRWAIDTDLLPQELFGQIRVGDHLERAEVGRRGGNHRAAAGLFAGCESSTNGPPHQLRGVDLRYRCGNFWPEGSPISNRKRARSRSRRVGRGPSVEAAHLQFCTGSLLLPDTN